MAKSQDALGMLRKTPIFARMSEETAKLLAGIPPRAFLQGEVIAHGTCAALGVLLSGKAAIYGRDSGKRVLLNRMEKGSVFDAATVFFSEKAIVSTVVAGSKCSVLFIERSVLETIIESDPAVAHDYIIFLSDKIGFLNRKIIAFTAKKADGALAGFLLDHIGEGDTLAVNMTRLASTLDMGRTTLYRAVETLKEAGAIAYDGREMRILDKKVLRDITKN